MDGGYGWGNRILAQEQNLGVGGPSQGKWGFIKRRKRNGIRKEGEKIKDWLIAKGYSWKKGFDYDEVFSLVVEHTSIRLVLALGAYLNVEWEQLYVKKTFFMMIWESKFTWNIQKGLDNLRWSTKLFKFSLYLTLFFLFNQPLFKTSKYQTL